MKLQASQGYRSDSVRPSTHRASPGLLFFRKDRMPSARGEGPRGGEGAAGAPSPQPRFQAVLFHLPVASPSLSQVQAGHIPQEAHGPRWGSPSSHTAQHRAGATGLGLRVRQPGSREQALRVSISKTQKSWLGRGS